MTTKYQTMTSTSHEFAPEASDLDAARDLGTQFAQYLNATPRDAQNWSALDENDDLPDFDYVALRERFGRVTPSMERAYKTGFNATLKPL